MSQQKWSFKNILKELLSTLIIFFFISLIINYIRKPEINENIYSYSMEDINHQKVDFESFKGKKLLVHFWATWCPTCKLEASNIEKLSQKYSVITIAVNSGTDEAIKRYLDKKGLTFQVINDKEGYFAQNFNIEAYPTTLIYNTEGKLKFAEVGYSTTIGLKSRLGIIH